MPLKCQFCGKEYIHDGKICHSCEEKAINSGLSSKDGKDHKWRCDNFLEINSLAYGCNIDNVEKLSQKLIECPDCGEVYSYGRNTCHICEGNILPFGKIYESEQNSYRWNCNAGISCKDTLSSILGTLRTIVKETPHLEILKNVDHDWNVITSVGVKNIQFDERKINNFLKFE
ncbi:MAG: hypothetical protein ACFFA0_05355 [Promethearchaeota archaeon]